MKRLLTLVMILGGYAIYAQNPVTLTQANMPFGPQVYYPALANLAGISTPAPGINQMWDYSSMTLQQLYAYSYLLPNNAHFPQAGYADTTVAVNFLAGTVYYTDYYYQENANYAACLGTETGTQFYNISGVTGGAHDSCIIPAQYLVFNNPLKVLAFPATMSSAWHNNYVDRVDFQLSIAAFGLSHVPSRRVSHFTRTDTVVGWGKVVVPAAGGPSVPYDALMVKRISIQADSFYMNNAPAPAALLTAFGMAQGQQTISNRYLFWRPNAVYPVLMMNFGSNNFTAPASVFYDYAVSPATSIPEPDAAGTFSVFPNPANGFITICGEQDALVAIADISGKKVREFQTAKGPNTLGTSGLPDGIYFVRITTGQGTEVRKLIIRN